MQSLNTNQMKKKQMKRINLKKLCPIARFKKRKILVPLHIYNFPYGQILLFQSYNPGAIKFLHNERPVKSIWKVKHHSCRKDLIIAVFSTSAFKQEGTSTLLWWHSYFSSIVKEQINDNQDKIFSHIFIFSWLEPHEENILQTKEVVLANLGSDKVARSITKSILERLIKKTWKPSFSIDWAHIVESVSFKQWITIFAENIFGRDYVLTPYKD